MKLKSRHLKVEALPGVLGNRGTRAIFPGEQRPKNKGKGKHRQFWGTGNRENQDFVLGEQGNKAIFSSGTREQVPPLGGPQSSEEVKSVRRYHPYVVQNDI